jgi:hypothetical protein
MARARESNGLTMADTTHSRRIPTRWAFRERVDVGAAIGAGLAAGSVFLTLMVALSVVFYDEAVWNIPQMIGAVLSGAVPSRLFESRLALLGISLHFTLAVLYALAFAGIVAEAWRGATAGIAFGIAVYFVNLHGFSALFPWFAELRTLDTLAAHALFGLLLAHVYGNLAEG